MKEITVKDVIEICNGELICGTEQQVCENFSKDTREIQAGDVYVGIKGENINGNELYKEAIQAGAKVCILEKESIGKEKIEDKKDVSIILVKNGIEALQKLASYKRSLYQIPVIAITGSVGKTSTKDMIASVVGQHYHVLKTQANYNNHIGLPLTILQLKDHTALVVEMGMNNVGEIRTLTNIAKPDICVITNVGTAHIGNLGSRENILKAKLEILEGMNQNGTVVINEDNDMLQNWHKTNPNYKICTFGIEQASNIMAKEVQLNETGSLFTTNALTKKVEVPIGGIHFVLNALCAIAVGKLLKLSEEEILNGIKTFQLTKGRMDIFENAQGIRFINDCYNANYDSMKASLEYLGKTKAKRKIAVLGDMLELGEYSKQLHEKVGEEVAKNQIDILITIGEEAKNIAKKAEEFGMNKEKIYIEETLEQGIQQLKRELQKEDFVLVKASNGMNFKKIIQEFRK